MLEEYLKLECETGLLNDKIGDFRYWLFIRDKLYMKIEELSSANTNIPTGNNTSKIAAFIDKMTSSSVVELVWKKICLKDILYVIKNLTISNPLLFIKKSKILIFTSNRRTLIDGKYYETWTDEIADSFGKDCLTVESLDVTSHRRPLYTKNIKEIDVVDIFPLLVSFINKLSCKKTLKKLVSEKVDKIERSLIEYIGISPNKEYLETLILTRFFWYHSKKRILKKIIKKVNPNIIIEVVGYETNNMIVNELGKQLSIPTIELQHGIIGMQHIAYNYLCRKTFKPLPDYIFFYSNYWKNTCRFPIKKTHQLAVGFPFFENQLKKYPPVISKDNRLRIIVLSQPVFKYEIVTFIDRLLCLFEEGKIRFSLTYKLHPAEYNQPIEDWKKITSHKNVKLINDSSDALYKLFSENDILIGVTSTAIFEGLAYGLNTFVLNIGNANERMIDLIENKYVTFCNTPEEVVNSEMLWTQTPPLKRNEFFEPNSMKNITGIINKLMNKGRKNVK